MRQKLQFLIWNELRIGLAVTDASPNVERNKDRVGAATTIRVFEKDHAVVVDLLEFLLLEVRFQFLVSETVLDEPVRDVFIAL